MTKGWKCEGRRHSLARRGIKTKMDDSRKQKMIEYVMSQPTRSTHHIRPSSVDTPREDVVGWEDVLTINDLSEIIYERVERGDSFQEIETELQKDYPDMSSEIIQEEYNDSLWVYARYGR